MLTFDFRREYVKTLESRLQAIETKLNTHDHTSQPLITQQHMSTPETNHGVVSISDIPIDQYEGESSFTRQSLGARQAAESMANPNDPAAGSTLNVAFDSLNGLLRPVQRDRAESQSHSNNSRQIPLCLPADLVLAMLQRFHGTGPIFISLEFLLTWQDRTETAIHFFISYQ